jgi:hypothetical protein
MAGIITNFRKNLAEYVLGEFLTLDERVAQYNYKVVGESLMPAKEHFHFNQKFYGGLQMMLSPIAYVAIPLNPLTFIIGAAVFADGVSRTLYGHGLVASMRDYYATHMNRGSGSSGSPSNILGHRRDS